MIFSQEFLNGLAAHTGFLPENLEKVGFLIRILQNISQHPFLKSRLALKGGTAINLFYLELPRLSVDIDLNYLGSSDREVMLKDKVQLETALGRILESLNLEIHRIPEEHAGGKWRLRLQSVFGGKQTLELDINYLMRVPIYSVQRRDAFELDSSLRVDFPLVSFEETFAGKIVALLDRLTARDVYDVHQLALAKKDYDLLKLKRATLLLGACIRKDWRQISVDDIDRISENEMNQQLRPLMHKDADHDFVRMKRGCKSFVEKLLKYEEEERIFLDELLDRGDYRIDLLYPKNSSTAQRLKHHPAVLWKALNVKDYRRGSSS